MDARIESRISPLTLLDRSRSRGPTILPATTTSASRYFDRTAVHRIRRNGASFIVESLVESKERHYAYILLDFAKQHCKRYLSLIFIVRDCTRVPNWKRTHARRREAEERRAIKSMGVERSSERAWLRKDDKTCASTRRPNV